MSGRPPLDPHKRFAALWQPEPNSGCWLWVGTGQRYGEFKYAGERLAHRASWVLHVGPIPTGLQVLHKCDTPPCVNPEHLFLGDNNDNVADRQAKMRGPSGIKNGRSKLTNADAMEIRQLIGFRASISSISKLYRIDRRVVRLICRGWRWGHLR